MKSYQSFQDLRMSLALIQVWDLQALDFQCQLTSFPFQQSCRLALEAQLVPQ